jgi:hypothetical protein
VPQAVSRAGRWWSGTGSNCRPSAFQAVYRFRLTGPVTDKEPAFLSWIRGQSISVGPGVVGENGVALEEVADLLAWRVIAIIN